jgi:N-methylhydantoinase B
MKPEVDLVTFEIIRHRLMQVMEESIIALENVSGSPVSSEAHDVMVSLYRADGALMVGGVGFLHHLTSASQAVKHILAEFGEDPGIFEDDAYFLNDAYTAALHPPDVYIISPIHFEGRLTGFVANFVHVTDIGAMSPGGFSPDARECYHEGFVSQGLKIVEGGKIRRDVFETFLRNVRDPGLTALDVKSQLAANHAAKEQMKAAYREYGVDVVDAVSSQLIEQSEQLMRERLRELPDGEWRAREYVDLPDGLHVVNLVATKRGDTLTYDFSGTDEQSAYGVNCSYWATWGALFAAVFPLLAWDITWNDGMTRPFEMVAPERTLVNAIRPAPISIATVGVIRIVNCLSVIVISKMLGSSARYANRATAIWQGSHANVEVFGRNADGEYFVYMLTDTFAGAGGARAFADGVDLGGEIPNVVSRWANVESEELNTPVRYLYRRPVPDSGGVGKYRGGLCHEFAIASDRVGDDKLGLVLFGMGLTSPIAHGVFGGYPGCQVDYLIFRDANGSDLPSSLETTSGSSVESVPWGEFYLRPQDVLYCRNNAGGGYGDPIDRDPDRVAGDVRTGHVTEEAARSIYGVALAPDGDVDAGGTLTARAAIRVARLGRPPAKEPTAAGTRSNGSRPIGEYLCFGDGDEILCRVCDELLSGAGADWKDAVPRAHVGLSAGGPNRPDSGEILLRQFFCPGCATLLDTEVARESDPPLYDRIMLPPLTADAAKRRTKGETDERHG